jgi:Zn-dependent protease
VPEVSSRVSPWFLALVAVTLVGGFLAASATTRPVLTTGIVLLVLAGWAVSLCLHEFGHAYTAYRGGDRSVRAKGYLTLDIRRYADLGLSLVLPILILLIGGIPLPGGAVWIDHAAIRSRGARSLVSLAGPATNLVLGAVLTAAVALVEMPIGLAVGLSCLAFIQVIAFVLNILPIPGLDGWGAIEPYLPPRARELGAKVRPWAPIILFAILWFFRPANTALWEGSYAIFGAFGGYVDGAQIGFSVFQFWN